MERLLIIALTAVLILAVTPDVGPMADGIAAKINCIASDADCELQAVDTCDR